MNKIQKTTSFQENNYFDLELARLYSPIIPKKFIMSIHNHFNI